MHNFLLGDTNKPCLKDVTFCELVVFLLYSITPLKVPQHKNNKHLLALRPALEDADNDFELRGRDDRGLAD